jgi:hypothetical protein
MVPVASREMRQDGIEEWVDGDGAHRRGVSAAAMAPNLALGATLRRWGGQNVTDKSRGRRQLGLWSFPRRVEKSNGGSSHDDLAPKRCSTTDNAVGEWVAELEARRGVTLATCRVMGGAAWWEPVAVAVLAYNTLVEERRRQGC